MTIKAPSDTSATYNNYGEVNVLGGSMTQTTVTSTRAGRSKGLSGDFMRDYKVF
ncbi:MAG: hypothetical protein ACR2KT_00060 [Methylocella sp.]